MPIVLVYNLIMSVILVLVLISITWFYIDVQRDKKKKVKIVKPLPVFNGWKRSKEQQKIADVEHGENLKVARIRYGKDYMAIKIQREDKSNGWLIYQRGSIELAEG